MSVNIAAAELRADVERIENMNEQIAVLREDRNNLFFELKSKGHDVKVLKKIVSDRELDPAKKADFDAMYDLYASKLGMPSNAHGEGGKQ